MAHDGFSRQCQPEGKGGFRQNHGHRLTPPCFPRTLAPLGEKAHDQLGKRLVCGGLRAPLRLLTQPTAGTFDWGRWSRIFLRGRQQVGGGGHPVLFGPRQLLGFCGTATRLPALGGSPATTHPALAGKGFRGLFFRDFGGESHRQGNAGEQKRKDHGQADQPPRSASPYCPEPQFHDKTKAPLMTQSYSGSLSTFTKLTSRCCVGYGKISAQFIFLKSRA